MAVTTITLGLIVRILPKDTRRSAFVGSIATATLGLSWALVALEGVVPELWSLLGGNLQNLIAAALVPEFPAAGRRGAYRGVYIHVVAPAILTSLWARYVVDVPSMRIVVISAAVALFLALTSRRLFNTPDGLRFNHGKALLAIANGIKAHVRPYDLVGRLGDDEFAVLLSGLVSRAAADLLPRLLESIAEQPTDYGGRLTVSIGRSSLVPDRVSTMEPGLREGSEEEDMLRRLVAAADGDLYGVKNTRY